MLLKGWEATFSTHKVWFHIFYYNDDVAWAYVGTQAPFLAHLSSCTFFPSAPYTTTPPPQGHSKHSAIGGNQRCRSWGMGLRTPLKSELSFSWGSGELTLEGSEGGGLVCSSRKAELWFQWDPNLPTPLGSPPLVPMHPQAQQGPLRTS